jgi:hypothetical protein
LKQEKRRDGSSNKICNTKRKLSALILKTSQKKKGEKCKKKRKKRIRVFGVERVN